MVLTVYMDLKTRSDKFKEDILLFPQLHTKKACLNKIVKKILIEFRNLLKLNSVCG